MSEPVDFYAAHASWLNAETETWMWKAIAKGTGNRVWRSMPKTASWPPLTLYYDFAVLEPGELAPGPGFIFGPFSVPDAP